MGKLLNFIFTDFFALHIDLVMKCESFLIESRKFLCFYVLNCGNEGRCRKALKLTGGKSSRKSSFVINVQQFPLAKNRNKNIDSDGKDINKKSSYLF